MLLAYRAAAILAVLGAIFTGGLMALSRVPRENGVPARVPVGVRLIGRVIDGGRIEPVAAVIPPDAGGGGGGDAGRVWPPPLLNPEARLRRGWDLSLGRPHAREILFTFDDGPNPSTTNRLLPMLSRAGVHAMFFVCGWRLEADEPLRSRARETLRQIVAEGHIVGNHTVHHRILPNLTPERLRYEIEHNADLIEEVIGQRPHFFRPPYGAYSEDVRRLLRSKQNELWMWSIDPHDYDLVGDSDAVAARVTLGIGNSGGGTVLLHDTHAWSVNAVPKILRWIERTNAERVLAGREPYRVLDPAEYLEGARARLPMIIEAERVAEAAQSRSRRHDGGSADVGAQSAEPTTGPVTEVSDGGAVIQGVHEETGHRDNGVDAGVVGARRRDGGVRQGRGVDQ